MTEASCKTVLRTTDVELIMSQFSDVTRSRATRCLQNHNGNVVSALSELCTTQAGIIDVKPPTVGCSSNHQSQTPPSPLHTTGNPSAMGSSSDHQTTQSHSPLSTAKLKAVYSSHSKVPPPPPSPLAVPAAAGPPPCAPPLPFSRPKSQGRMTTLGYCGQQSLALLLLHHPRCGAHRLHALPPHFIEPVCRLLLRCSASPVELETRMGYDVQVGREMWHLAANQPGRDPMMGDSLPLVYVWRDDGRVVLSISPWSNGAWKLWQGYENWQQVFSRLNQKEVESLLVPDQAAVIPVVGHTGMSYGKVLRKGSLQFEKLPQGLLIRFLGGCNGEILIPVANNPTIFFTADRTYSSTISSRCPISILKKRLF